LHARERELAEREAAFQNAEQRADAERGRLAKREKRTSELEESLHGRIRELDEREAAVDEREARVQADHDLREDKLERWQAELSDLERRLQHKETELAEYVAQVQGALNKRQTVG
ncbi:MAG TPA: hypothetical protein VK896_09435, partial [Gaiellaceae bacterium]|nr:hypothetical protein [Gaiellaceae bacterium]